MPLPGPLSGTTIVVTGGSAGIGAAAARRMLSLGATVHVVGRDQAKTAAVAAELGTPPLTADFTSLADVRRLAADLLATVPDLDVLANNAGGTWPRRSITADGQERTFQVNHLAPYLLTRLLLDRLVERRATVVTTSSAAHRTGHLDLADPGHLRGRFSGFRAYGTSKLDNILFTRELARRAPAVRAAAFHPGVVATEFARDSLLTGLFYRTPLSRTMRSPDSGADTMVWLAQDDSWASGGYYADRKPARASRPASHATLARDLWERSAELVGLPA